MSGVAVPPGGDGFARLRFDTPVVLTRGDRLVLRSPSPPVTIGGAVVLDPEPHPGRLRRPSSVARFQELEDAGRVARTWIREAGGRGLPVADLGRRGGLDRERASRLVRDATDAGEIAVVGGRAFELTRLVDAKRRTVTALEEYHRAHPDEVGVPREDLRHQVAPGAAGEFFDAVVTSLAGAGHVTGTDRLRLSTHNPTLGGARAAAAAAIVAGLAGANLAPPDLPALARAAGIPEAQCRQLLQVLVRERAVVKLEELFFHPDALRVLRNDVAGLGAGAALDINWFKTRYGLSRKYAIPLLEWLDRERVTRRVGSGRVVLAQ
jgi:selenocysteine-specific elongation factor